MIRRGGLGAAKESPFMRELHKLRALGYAYVAFEWNGDADEGSAHAWLVRAAHNVLHAELVAEGKDGIGALRALVAKVEAIRLEAPPSEEG